MPKTLKNAFLTVALLIAIAVIVELLAYGIFSVGLATRIETPAVTHPFHPYLGWENARNATLTGTRCGGRHAWTINTDNEGRAVTPHFNYEQPDVSIAVLGGSTMFGVGSSGNATTVPSLIERELNERTNGWVEVYNLAVNGYMSFQEMLCLERFLATTKVDIAIAISGKNDAHHAAYEEDAEFGMLPARFHRKAEFLRSVERGELEIFHIGASHLVNHLRRRFHAIDLFGRILDPIRAGGGGKTRREMVTPDEKGIEWRAQRIMTNHAMIDVMAKRHGIQYFLFLQPTAITKKTLTEEEKQCIESLSQYDAEHYFGIERAFYEAIRGCEKPFAFYDITTCLDGVSEPAYVDAAHYRDNAAGVVADAVCDVITPVVVDLISSMRE